MRKMVRQFESLFESFESFEALDAYIHELYKAYKSRPIEGFITGTMRTFMYSATILAQV